MGHDFFEHCPDGNFATEKTLYLSTGHPRICLCSDFGQFIPQEPIFLGGFARVAPRAFDTFQLIIVMAVLAVAFIGSIVFIKRLKN